MIFYLLNPSYVNNMIIFFFTYIEIENYIGVTYVNNSVS